MGAAVVILIILLIGSLVGTFVFLLPEKRAPYLNRFWTWVRNFLKMKDMYLEKFLRGLYVIATVTTFVLCVGGGIVMPFAIPNRNFGQILLGLIGGLLGGLLAAVIMLFITRIIYESIMLNVSLTKAAKSLDNKIGGSRVEARPEPRAEARSEASYEEPRRRSAPQQPASQSRLVVCRRCGARYDSRRGYCPNCEDRNDRW